MTVSERQMGHSSVAGMIEYPPQIPVIADGLFQHTSKATGPWETDITLPNINCTKCTLQIVEFMAGTGLTKDGDYTYHHCADLQITRLTCSKPVDAAWTAGKVAKSSIRYSLIGVPFVGVACASVSSHGERGDMFSSLSGDRPGESGLK